MLLDITAARSLARLHLAATVPDCWAHAQSVAGHAEDVAEVVGPLDRDLLLCVAWVHGIGEAPPLARTGFVPLDGAAYLAEHGWPARLVNLVAHHAEARLVAPAHGLATELARFPLEQSVVSDALTYADLAAGSAGRRRSLRQRLEDIEEHDGPAGEALRTAQLERRRALFGAVHRTEQRLAGLHRGHRSA